MGKNKRHGRRAKRQPKQAIAQHNLDKLVRAGVVMTESSISEQTTYGDLKEECARAGA